MFRFFLFAILIFSFSQCQNVSENTLIASPDTVDTTKFPFKEYAYVKTYSINRTWDLDSLFFATLGYSTSQYNDESDTIYDENALLGNFWVGERSIYNSKKEKAKTAQFIKKLNRFEVRRLQNILIENEGVSYSSYCLFRYRDAIVFYNKNDEPVEWINFCFDCQEGDIFFEYENWDKLKQFFIDLGHPILEDKE